jgi:hypothetical protein
MHLNIRRIMKLITFQQLMSFPSLSFLNVLQLFAISKISDFELLNTSTIYFKCIQSIHLY